jgi:uncharacterized protein (DUF488 family)
LLKIKLWTIGHGARSIEEFITLLQNSRIELLVDIRRFPTSKTTHFRKDELEKILNAREIEYKWLGDKLGGFREGGYEKYMQSDTFRKGIDELVEESSKKRTCIMCLEISPKGCHRRFISRYLHGLGHDVFHIISFSRVQSEEENIRLDRYH